MRGNRIRELLNEDKPTLGTRVRINWPDIVELVGHTGVFDYIEFVAEYAPYDLNVLDNLCRAAELHNLGTMIKVDYAGVDYWAARAVGAGFGSVLFTDARSVDDVQRFISIVRPDTPEYGGTYGVSARRITAGAYGSAEDYVRYVKDIVVAIMLEKKGGYDALEEILALDDVDMVQWGPSDFSWSIGKPGRRDDPEVKEAEQRIIDTCLKMNVHPRIEVQTPDAAKRYLDMGVRHFNLNTDTAILAGWWRTNGEELRKALEG